MRWAIMADIRQVVLEFTRLWYSPLCEREREACLLSTGYVHTCAPRRRQREEYPIARGQNPGRVRVVVK